MHEKRVVRLIVWNFLNQQHLKFKMLPPIPGKNTRRQVDLITLPSGHQVPASAVKHTDLKAGPHDAIDHLPRLPGALAGANSRFLMEYKKHRDKEVRRLASMEHEEEREKGRIELEMRKDERQRTLEEEAAKKRERRQKRKLGKSSDGLNLPAEVVKQIKDVEKSDHAVPEPETKRMHPYALNAASVSPAQPRTRISSSIRILDDDD
jgi:hypothetical protein